MAAREPSRLAAFDTEGRLSRTGLWRLFDRFALALLAGTIVNLLVMCPPQVGKALAHETPILTTKGWKQHGTIQPGDYVYGPTGAPVLVEAVTTSYEDDCYCVRFDDGSEIVAAARHEWAVEIDRDCGARHGLPKGHRHDEIRETQSLLSGYNRRPPRIPVAHSLDGVAQDLPVDPYLLGVWLGNGHKHSGMVTCGAQDIAHYAHLGRVIPRGEHYMLGIRGLQSKLRALGILHDKHGIPEAYLSAPRAQRLALLQGLMDTDGHCTKTGACEFTSIIKTLADDVASLVASCGLKPHVYKGRAMLNGKDCGPKYRITFYPTADERVFRLERKQQRIKTEVRERARYRYVKAVEPCGRRGVKCLQVDGGLYLAGRHLIPTHNSKYWSTYFPAWWIGRNPEHRVVLGSHGAMYAASLGRATRDVLARRGGDVFGVRLREDVAAANEWQLANPHTGGMVTAGIEGGVAGRAAEVAIADDIVADAAAAESRVIKDRIWGWWEEELSARLQKNGRRVMVMTRRAVDDPPGRIMDLKQSGKEPWTIVRLPALAEEPEIWTDLGWQRQPGEALVPELHSAEEYQRVKLARGAHVWAGLYQQRPYPRGGGDFKGEWFRIVEANPEAQLRVRAWDLAYSESPTAKRTAGVLMSKRKEGDSHRYHIEDAVYGRWGSGRRNERILQQAQLDGKRVPIVLEEEGGSGGPTQVDELVRKLDGWRVIRSRAAAGGSKVLRADAMASQAEVGNVTIRAGAWNADFLAEVDAFPGGPTIDLVDAAAHAYNWLASHAPAVQPFYAEVKL